MTALHEGAPARVVRDGQPITGRITCLFTVGFEGRATVELPGGHLITVPLDALEAVPETLPTEPGTQWVGQTVFGPPSAFWTLADHGERRPRYVSVDGVLYTRAAAVSAGLRVVG